MKKHYITDFAYRRRRRTKVMMRRMKVWSETIEGKWPQTQPRGGGFDKWLAPVGQRTIKPPRSSWHMQRRYIDLILRAAARMRDYKPDKVRHARVTAIIAYPNLFYGGVHIFFNDDYWAGFTERHQPDDVWTPLPLSRSLLRTYRLKLPEGFVERGYSTYWRDDDHEDKGDVWIYSEAR